jgi:hypothetical protein
VWLLFKLGPAGGAAVRHDHPARRRPTPRRLVIRLKRQPEGRNELPRRRWAGLRTRAVASLMTVVTAAAGALALTFGTDVGHALATALVKALRLLP